MGWKVERHGGKQNDRWIAVYDGDEEAQARTIYEQKRRELRQGGVRLSENDEVKEKFEKPRLNRVPMRNPKAAAAAAAARHNR